MVTRNERNAIIQHGTMTMVRRSVLEQVGRWGVSTITEDTELGLRIFEQGHEAVYIDQSYGHGLIPDTFTDYKNSDIAGLMAPCKFCVNMLVSYWVPGQANSVQASAIISWRVGCPGLPMASI